MIFVPDSVRGPLAIPEETVQNIAVGGGIPSAGIGQRAAGGDSV